MLLDRITKENDIKKIPEEEWPDLAEEIREFLIDKISKSGGHLASNLGAVELTMALHLTFELPKDKIIWDVGHQSYTHKLLTGRREGFDNLRKFGGMAGFPKTKESPCDPFNTGHSSTSLSAGLGLVKARDIQGGDNYVISVIGDGSMTGGMAYEALNNAGKLTTNYIMILNDNDMSISENVGGLSKYLNSIRSNVGYQDFKYAIYKGLLSIPGGDGMIKSLRRAKSSVKNLMVPGMFFEDMGVTYLGPVDGHNIKEIIQALNDAKRMKKACLIHVVTQRGMGYLPAVNHPARFHGTDPFDVETGLPLNPKAKPGYTDIFSTVMVKLGDRDDKVVAVTAAMAEGTGLKRFRNAYPDRFFDVGIAEEHAVTFAAGLAAGGLKPVVAIYSSFLQRAYDQILHDVCIQGLPVVFAIDRAGVVGSDGETHQGIFDISFLSSIPGLTIMAPKNKWELSDMLKFALTLNAPVAVRYPRGEAYDGLEEFRAPIELGKSEIIYRESDIALVALGSMVKTAETVRTMLKDKGFNCTLVNARFAKPSDIEGLRELADDHSLIVTMEENVITGGFGEQTRELMAENGISADVLTIAIPDEYVEHGNVELLKKEIGIDADSIFERILERCKAQGT
ncbi:MAG: 1-deoxy-D-xylulose-5-phosphate synthase [Lachnospiraceae bacterium]|nr:1-deoxy-D-xylulose-5-phosphate synthase [Lachnospiraceae bacterium]